MSKIQIVTLYNGYMFRNEQGIVQNAKSASYLLISNEDKIVVDTSMASERKNIIKGLTDNGIRPEDVNIVINTHLHLDHIGNNEIFVNADFFADELEFLSSYALRDMRRLSKINQIEPPYQVIPGVSIIATPGHTAGSISVVVERNFTSDGKEWWITGDALPIKECYYNWNAPIIRVDERAAYESMLKIISKADIVYCGHDLPIKITRPHSVKVLHRIEFLKNKFEQTNV